MPKRHFIKLLPTADYLRECFEYEPQTGVLKWKPRPREHFNTKRVWSIRNTRFAGQLAGRWNKGYQEIMLDKVRYFAHRIIFKLMLNQEPPETLDHKNRTRGDNRWDNLRPATILQQNRNTNLRRDNTSGFRGVCRATNGGWRAQLGHHYLGRFDTAEEAAAVAEAARRALHGEYYPD